MVVSLTILPAGWWRLAAAAWLLLLVALQVLLVGRSPVVLLQRGNAQRGGWHN
jgi:hypothetical protein